MSGKVSDLPIRLTMSGKVSDLPIRFKRAVFTQEKIDRINFRSGNGGRVIRNPPGVTTRCWSRAWSHDSLSHGIDKMAMLIGRNASLWLRSHHKCFVAYAVCAR